MGVVEARAKVKQTALARGGEIGDPRIQRIRPLALETATVSSPELASRGKLTPVGFGLATGACTGEKRGTSPRSPARRATRRKHQPKPERHQAVVVIAGQTLKTAVLSGRAGDRLFIVTICAKEPLSTCLCPRSEGMNVVPRRHHAELFLYPV